jgi:uncharacterized protein
MSNDKASPIHASERIDLIDALRGLAVCGILIGNMQWFSGYGTIPPALDTAATQADHIAKFLVHFIVEGKFYSIFSFLFGFGFALQIAKAEERDDAKATVFKRRLFWLLVIGALHATLLWYGDILSVYALMGFVLLLFRKRANATILKWIAVFMIVPVVTYAIVCVLFVAFVPPDTVATVNAEQENQWPATMTTVSTGGYIAIMSSYNLMILAFRWIGLFVQMRLPKILAMFLLGVYAYRIGVLKDPEQHRGLLTKVAVFGLILGIIGNVMMAGLAGNEAPFPPSPASLVGVVGYAFGVPALALAIVAAVALGWQSSPARKVLSVFAPVGRMALTNYLIQTVVSITIFYGFGFGLFGSVGAARATLIALGIFAAQVIVSTVWLRFFAFGPMEWLWRQLTYRRRLPLRKTAAA